MRDLYDVIDAMLVEIPPEEVPLIARLKSIKNSLSYVAPEGMVNRWKVTQSVLAKEVGVPSDGWKMRVAEIFRGSGK